MKVTRSYEVWVGGDMAGDMLTRQEAIDLAKKELKDIANEKPNYDIDVVVDEIIHYEIDENDVETLEALL